MCIKKINLLHATGLFLYPLKAFVNLRFFDTFRARERPLARNGLIIYTVSFTLSSSPPEVFLGKGVLKICSKFTGEQPCRSVITINFQSNFIEITLWHGCSPVNLLHIFRTLFSRNTSGGLLLQYTREINRA